MKKKILSLFLSLAILAPAFADTTTTRFGLTKPDVGSASWGPKINTNSDTIDNAAGLSLSNTFTGANTFGAGSTVAISTDATVSGNFAVGSVNKKKRLTLIDATSANTTPGTNPIFWIGGGNTSNSTLSEIGFTYGFTGAYTETYTPVTFGYQLTSGSGNTKGDLVFCTRNVTTDTAPTERMRITAAGQVQLNAGSVSAPSLHFGDSGSGVYKFFTNQIGIAANGIAAICFQSTNVSPLLPVYNIDGTSSAPAYAFSNEPGLGWYRPTNHDAFLVEQATNLIAATPTGVSILGTTTNDNASTGYFGEVVRANRAVGSPLSSSGTSNWDNVTSISLTAGDWDVSGQVAFILNTGTGLTRVLGAVSINSGGTTTDHVSGDNECDAFLPTANANGYATIAAYRISLSATTTVYLKSRVSFTGGTPQSYGRISARRVR